MSSDSNANEASIPLPPAGPSWVVRTPNGPLAWPGAWGRHSRSRPSVLICGTGLASVPVWEGQRAQKCDRAGPGAGSTLIHRLAFALLRTFGKIVRRQMLPRKTLVITVVAEWAARGPRRSLPPCVRPARSPPPLPARAPAGSETTIVPTATSGGGNRVIYGHVLSDCLRRLFSVPCVRPGGRRRGWVTRRRWVHARVAGPSRDAGTPLAS